MDLFSASPFYSVDVYACAQDGVTLSSCLWLLVSFETGECSSPPPISCPFLSSFLLYLLCILQSRCSQLFSVKGQTVNILGFAGHMVSVTTIQLLLEPKGSLSDTNCILTEWLWLNSNKTLFAEPGGGLDLAQTSSVLTPALHLRSLTPLFSWII